MPPATVRLWSLPRAAALSLLLTAGGCAPPEGTAGGFGPGDPAAVPAFRETIAASQTVSRLALPKTGGGNAELIRALLSPAAIAAGARQSASTAVAMREAVPRALGQPSARPARLFQIERAFALTGSGRPVVVLICDTCGTATLAMRPAGETGDVILPPQFDLGALGASLPP